jgi:hypothetical protein
VMLIWWVRLLTTVLKIMGVVAPRTGTIKTADAIRYDVVRSWLITL